MPIAVSDTEVGSVTRDILADIRRDLRKGSGVRLTFTRRAFQMLPPLKQPRILDVGCGEGKPTLELAKLSDGDVVALDIDQAALNELSSRIEEAGLAGRVTVVKASMRDMDFAEESFDVIWSEGSAPVIGFEAALNDWRRFIKSGGFLVIHEMIWLRPNPPEDLVDHWHKVYPGIATVSDHIEQIKLHGYELIADFQLPDDVWWLDYYGPLEERIREFRDRCPGDPDLHRVLAEQEREVDLFKKFSGWYGSGFFIMRKCSVAKPIDT